MSIIREKLGKVYWIKLNNPKRRNCITAEMYDEMVAGLDEANSDPDVVLTVYTGVGEFYSSGNDFSPANAAKLMENIENPDFVNPYKRWTDRLIIHKKPLVALVNGPAIGIACTTLSIFDMVVASDKAYFSTPFSEMGLVPEGTSSITFARTMGHTKAAAMALFAEDMSAHDAHICGFVAKVIPHSEFEQKTKALVEKWSKLAPEALIISKDMLRPHSHRNRLLAANQDELTVLNSRFASEEAFSRISAKFGPEKNKKSKL